MMCVPLLKTMAPLLWQGVGVIVPFAEGGRVKLVPLPFLAGVTETAVQLPRASADARRMAEQMRTREFIVDMKSFSNRVSFIP